MCEGLEYRCLFPEGVLGAEAALTVQHPFRTGHTNRVPVIQGTAWRRSKPVMLPWDTCLSEVPKLGSPVYKQSLVHRGILQHRDVHLPHT